MIAYGDCEVTRAQVSFQWKNPDIILKNPDFLLKNVDFIIKHRQDAD